VTAWPLIDRPERPVAGFARHRLRRRGSVRTHAGAIADAHWAADAFMARELLDCNRDLPRSAVAAVLSPGHLRESCSMLIRSVVVAVVSLLCLATARAEDLPKTHFKVIGTTSTSVGSTIDEIPFWRDTVPKDSNGAVTADDTPLDQMGIDDKTMLRLLKLGVMDIASMDISKMAGDDPHFEGCDLAGVAQTADRARAACEAWRGVLDRQMEKNWNAKLLAIGGNPPQVFWCRAPVSGLADLKGRKIRVFNNSMRDFMAGVGASSINMSFAEVVPALNNNVVDCAVTGTLSGNTAGWFEVTKAIYPLSFGWSINVTAINLNTWNKLSPAVQAFLVKEMKGYEDKMWVTIKAAPSKRKTATLASSHARWGSWHI
jgi:TRAP-type C4-dicarboxylate transport system substrate-binding protein